MTISTKRVHDKAEPTDGTRILIVLHESIANLKKCPYDKLMKELAPSYDLHRKFQLNIKNHKWTEVEWEECSKRFKEEMLASIWSRNAIAKLSEMSAAGQKITLLCYCPDEKFCHRTLVKDLIDNWQTINK
jgi:uncharacterized protein YeaO (DUF488 family)